MKIRYVANFNDGTEWAKGAVYNALALDSAGYDVYCSEVKYNNVTQVIENRITDLLQKKSDSFDAVIQHILPIDYKYIGGVKNIGFIGLESVGFFNKVWLANLKMMDEIFVPNVSSQNALRMHNIESKVFNHSFNLSKVQNSQSQASIAELNNSFNFCFVGEFSERKNLEALLIAFHNEFNYSEPVNLYIKTSGKTLKDIQDFCSSVKTGMKKTTRYKNEIIVVDNIDDSVLWATMKQCHVFVMPSRGESWCYPAIEAMALGIPVIYTGGTAIGDYIVNGESGFAINSYPSPCYKVNDTFQDLYTSKDVWLEPNILHLQGLMRQMYNSDLSKYSAKCLEDVTKYDYKNSKLVEGLL